jgi:hypothetical protein
MLSAIFKPKYAALLIDAAYLEIGAAQLQLHPQVSLQVLRQVLERSCGVSLLGNAQFEIKEAVYFATRMRETEAHRTEARKAQYIVKEYDLKRFKNGPVKVQAGADVGLVTKMLTLATLPTGRPIDRFIVLAGDRDFEDAFQFVREVLYKQIWVVGFKGDDSVSPRLQQYADRVLWLEDLWGEVACTQAQAQPQPQPQAQAQPQVQAQPQPQAQKAVEAVEVCVGAQLAGVVRGVEQYGAFVDVGWLKVSLCERPPAPATPATPVIFLSHTNGCLKGRTAARVRVEHANGANGDGHGKGTRPFTAGPGRGGAGGRIGPGGAPAPAARVRAERRRRAARRPARGGAGERPHAPARPLPQHTDRRSAARAAMHAGGCAQVLRMDAAAKKLSLSLVAVTPAVAGDGGGGGGGAVTGPGGGSRSCGAGGGGGGGGRGGTPLPAPSAVPARTPVRGGGKGGGGGRRGAGGQTGAPAHAPATPALPVRSRCTLRPPGAAGATAAVAVAGGGAGGADGGGGAGRRGKRKRGHDDDEDGGGDGAEGGAEGEARGGGEGLKQAMAAEGAGGAGGDGGGDGDAEPQGKRRRTSDRGEGCVVS